MGENPVLKTLAGNATGFILGLLLTFVSLVPDRHLSEMGKLLLSLTIVLATVVLVLAYLAKQYMQGFIDARRGFDAAPQMLQFRKTSKVCKLKENGDAELEIDMHVGNMSDREMTQFSLPVIADLYGKGDDPSPVIQVLSIRVDREEVPRPADSYVKEGILRGSDSVQEHGHIQVSVPGGLQPPSGSRKVGPKRRVSIRYSIQGAFGNLRTDEYILLHAHYLTDQIQATVFAPPGWRIYVLGNRIDARDKIAKLVDHRETAQLEKPDSSAKDALRWRVEKPKLNYLYRLHFVCEPPKEAPAQS